MEPTYTNPEREPFGLDDEAFTLALTDVVMTALKDDPMVGLTMTAEADGRCKAIYGVGLDECGVEQTDAVFSAIMLDVAFQMVSRFSAPPESRV